MLKSIERLDWLHSGDIRPYVYIRPESRIKNPGKNFSLDWFPFEPMKKNPLDRDDVSFGNQILNLEHRAFGQKGLEMPRWVFYDCAILPGFVAGFAAKTEALSEVAKEELEIDQSNQEPWTPISLFIIIPTMVPGEWVAHNLCSINSLLPRKDKYYGLGFLSKAFGMWYANIETCIGITQWKSPAIRLHSHYGYFEILTAYTPIHSYPRTLTYRLNVNVKEWKRFFNHEQDEDFNKKFDLSGFGVDPKSDESLNQFQEKLEAGARPYYLNASQIRSRDLDAELDVFQVKPGINV